MFKLVSDYKQIRDQLKTKNIKSKRKDNKKRE